MAKKPKVLDTIPEAPAENLPPEMGAATVVPEVEAHPHAAELEVIEAEIAAIGDPRKALEENNAALILLRQDAQRAAESFARKIGEFADRNRTLQKQACVTGDRLAALIRRRDELKGAG